MDPISTIAVTAIVTTVLRAWSRNLPIEPALDGAVRGDRGSFDAKTVDDCLDVLEAAFQSDLWKQIDNQEKVRLIERVDYVLGIAQERFCE